MTYTTSRQIDQDLINQNLVIGIDYTRKEWQTRQYEYKGLNEQATKAIINAINVALGYPPQPIDDLSED
jgi:hypothetical protein